MVTVKILNSHTLATLKAEASKAKLKGFSALKKPALIELMMKSKSKFRHIKMKLTKAQAEEAERKAKHEKVKYLLREGELMSVQGHNGGIKMGFGLKKLDEDLLKEGKGSFVYQLDKQWFNSLGDYADDKVFAIQENLKIKINEVRGVQRIEGYKTIHYPEKEWIPVKRSLERGRVRKIINWNYMLPKNVVHQSQILKI
tara:strand:+ start:47 stop:643 length:597 start_codon:yes stop_codon:yes gene_type:complete